MICFSSMEPSINLTESMSSEDSRSMSETGATPRVCVVCKSDSKPIVSDPSITQIRDLLHHAKRMVELGEVHVRPLSDFMSSLSESELEQVRYHSHCRKKIVNKPLLERAERRRAHSDSHSPAQPAKRGRPANSSTPNRTHRNASVIPKETVCIFASPSGKCKYHEEELHKVVSINRGQTLLDIQSNTIDDHIRASLSSLHQPGDAHAQEKWYHSSCLQNARRTCSNDTGCIDNSPNNITKVISDDQIVKHVQTLFISDPELVLNMSQINSMYMSIIKENNIEPLSGDQKKYLKQILCDRIPNIMFVQPPQKNESERVMLSKYLGKAVNYATTNAPNAVVDSVLAAASAMRAELLECRNEWQFSDYSSLQKWKNPPLTELFLTQLWYGSHTESAIGKRDIEVSKCVEVGCQFLVQNSHTDRQVRHKPKRDTAFLRRVETPLSVALPLTLHQRVRDKTLVSVLSSVYLGTGYENVLNITKRIEHAVVLRMNETGGYCLPDFVKKGVTVFFAVDNIDFLEDTPYGQSTLHGALAVIYQEDVEDAEPINPPLVIPDKPPRTPLHVEIKYQNDPVIQKKPIRFNSYTIGHRASLLNTFRQYDATWALANHVVNTDCDVNILNGVASDTQLELDPISEDVYLTRTHDDDVSPISEDVATAPDYECELEPVSEDVAMTQSPGTEVGTNSEVHKPSDVSTHTFLSVIEAPKKTGKRSKTDVMPTWAATKSLIMAGKRVNRTNSEVVTPLFKSPPTDYATLYSILTLTQGISAVVVGPERRTIITLDLDLYERAIKIQQSVGNTNWVLRAGELHICFAALHALGKYIEGSGLDTVAVETGIYSPAALRGIYTGKAFKRGVEYHLMNALACFFFKFDAVLGEMQHDASLRKQCEELKASLHTRSDGVPDMYDELSSTYREEMESKVTDMDVKELAKFLTNYMTQVECLLHIISACREGNWEAYLAALDDQIQYFFAHDLYHYARMMPVHLAQMNQLEHDDPTTWKALKDGNFCVKKSETPFTALFADQALEQKIKQLKGAGGIVGITQDEISLDRVINTLPHITSMVSDWLGGFPRYSHVASYSGEHYQLSGGIAIRSTRNALKLKESIELHCEGNPFIVGTPLKSIASSVLIPEAAKEDILDRDEKGLDSYRKFVRETLLIDSPKSVWDTMKKTKLKTFNTWMEKTRVSVGDKVIKLREERQLLARFLVIQQSRPELVPRLPSTIGDYEMAVTPRSMFASDGSLLIPTDKASTLHAIEEAKPTQPTCDDVPDCDSDMIDSDCNSHLDRVIIIDGMAVVQSMKKSPTMRTIVNFTEAFVKRIVGLVKPYDEGRVLFDRYDIVQSLKQKTRTKRAGGFVTEFAIHDKMDIARITLKELLSASKTKATLSNILAEALLAEYKWSKKKMVVACGTTVRANEPHTVTEAMSTHNHEEADTMIPLHVLDSIRYSTIRDIDVWSPDTDVLILLIDLVAHGRLGSLTKLKFLTGKGNRYRSIDVLERVHSIGSAKSKGLIGVHNFTGADWGGRFVGISKKAWITAYLLLSEDDPIVSTLQLLGEGVLSDDHLVSGDLPEEVRPLEKFVCSVYSPGGPTTIPTLRWDLFRSRNLEGEKLPPTRATLMPHILRTNFVAMRDKSYTIPHPYLPPLEDNGWIAVNQRYDPVRCLCKPAPEAVLELIKCGCQASCKGNCSCKKNSLPCTALCKCHKSDCANLPDYRMMEDEDDDI